MGSAYTILGAKVPAHWISIATLSAAIGGAVIPSYLPSKKTEAVKAPEPVVQQQAEGDFDVEKLLKYVLLFG